MGRSLYAAYFEQGPTSISVSFPQFPGCITVGDDLADAYHNAQEALTFHMEGMVDDGLLIPAPAHPSALPPPDTEAQFPVLVEVNTPAEGEGRAARVNSTLPQRLLDRIDAAAGGNRSGWLAEAAREKLQREAGGRR